MRIIEQAVDLTIPYVLRPRKEVPYIDRLHVSLELSCLSTPAYFSIFPTSCNAILFPGMYSKITSKKSPSFCMTTFSAGLANLTALLPHSHDCSCYVTRRILAPASLQFLKHTCTHTRLRALYWLVTTLVCVTCAWSWRRCEINPAIIIMW